jgi:hypothetical protein
LFCSTASFIFGVLKTFQILLVINGLRGDETLPLEDAFSLNVVLFGSSEKVSLCLASLDVIPLTFALERSTWSIKPSLRDGAIVEVSVAEEGEPTGVLDFFK